MSIEVVELFVGVGGFRRGLEGVSSEFTKGLQTVFKQSGPINGNRVENLNGLMIAMLVILESVLMLI